MDHSCAKVKVECGGGIPTLALAVGEDEIRREQLAVEARDAANISEFRVTGSLRTAWYEGQRCDPSLAGSIRKPEPPMKMSGDGLLEREKSPSRQVKLSASQWFPTGLRARMGYLAPRLL